jgi:hypothetical protein
MNITLTAAVAEDRTDDARHLAVCLGLHEGRDASDWLGAFGAARIDATGRRWRVLSGGVSADFVGRAVSATLTRPAADTGTLDADGRPTERGYVVNLTAARRAQAALLIWSPPEADTPAGPLPRAVDHPERLLVILGLPGLDALTAMGLLAEPDDI